MKRTIAAICLALLLSTAANAQNSCYKCHLQNEGSGPGPAHDWPTSIHFRNGIACADCHGGNPRSDDPLVAMNRARGFLGKPSPTQVPNFCGKCHEAIRDNYLESAHAKALFAGVRPAPNCVTCHTAHRQQKVTLDLINPQTCGQCHSYDRAARLKEAMGGMEKDLTSLSKEERRIFLNGIDTEEEQKALFDVRNRVHRLTHVLDINKILPELAAVRPDLNRVQHEVDLKQKELEDRRHQGNILMGLFFVGAIAAYATHKKLMEPHTREK